MNIEILNKYAPCFPDSTSLNFANKPFNIPDIQKKLTAPEKNINDSYTPIVLIDKGPFANNIPVKKKPPNRNS